MTAELLSVQSVSPGLPCRSVPQTVKMKFKSYKSNEIGIEFRVWAPSYNRVDHRLYLLGSLKELGAWAIESALEAYPTKHLQIWSVETAVPPESRFEWVWLKVDMKTKRVTWERSIKRNRIVNSFSGILHTIWGEQNEVFLQTAAHVHMTTYKKVEEGSVLALTGNAVTLGNWDPRRAILASEFPNKSGYWKASFCFDAGTNLEFKWAVLKEGALDSVVMTENLPHNLFGRNTWMRVAAPWMTTSTIVVDILPLDERLDSKMGRTDIIVQDRLKRMNEIRNWMMKGRSGLDLLRSHASGPTSKRSRSPKLIHDNEICDALKALWKLEPKENGELDTNSADQSKKQQSIVSQTYAIKGVGQSEVPTDAMNNGCSSWSNLVPEGDCRVLEYPGHGDVSLWALSMDMIKKSLQSTEEDQEKHNQAGRDGEESLKVPEAQQQAHGDDSKTRESKAVSTPLLAQPETAEKESVLGTFDTEYDGNGSIKYADEKLERNKEVFAEKEEEALIDSGARKVISRMFCEADECSDAEDEKCVVLKRALSKDNFTPECSRKELAEQEQAFNCSECFRLLEIFQSDEILTARKRNVEATPSETCAEDSGLASFDPDTYMSRSSNENTSIESEIPFLLEEINNEYQEQDFNLSSIEKSFLISKEKEIDANKYDYNFWRDEGFFGPEFSPESFHEWGKMANDPPPEDVSESPECLETWPAYWEMVQHTRQMSQPLFVQQNSGINVPGQQEGVYPEQESPLRPSLSEIYDTEECMSTPVFFKQTVSPMASAPERTLGHVYQHQSGRSYWEQWTNGTELDFSYPCPLADDVQESLTEPCSSAGDSDMQASATSPLKKNNYENKIALNATGSCKESGESGDAPNCKENLNYPLGNTMCSTTDECSNLVNFSFEDLTTYERRLMAQALESEWGRLSITGDQKEKDQPNQTNMKKSSRNENCVQTPHIHPRRRHQTVSLSMKELEGIVEQDSILEDRRALARQAEFMWGQAPSSKCR